jgi:universal stress protein E
MQLEPHILVVIDPMGGDRQAAVDKAAILARAFHASVELLYCDLIPHERSTLLALDPFMQPAIGLQAQTLLDKLAAPMRDQGIEVAVRPVVARASLHESILSYLSTSKATLLVKDTHHHSFARRTFLQNTDWHLAHSSTVPLLLTKKRIWGQPPKILAAIDPHAEKVGVAALNRKILKCASTWASALTANLHVIHAYIPSALAAAVSSGTPAETPEIARRLECESTYIRGQIAAFTRACDISSSDLRVEVGTPIERLVDSVNDLGIDLVVIGASSHGRWHRIVTGSTASAVLESLPSDLIVVRPD